MSDTTTTKRPKFNFDVLTLGEVATIEDLSGTAVSALSVETPQGKFLASLYMVAKRRSGEPTFTFNQAMNTPMLEAQDFLGLNDDDETDADAEGNGDSSPESAPE
jgi:hypothetical protein